MNWNVRHEELTLAQLNNWLAEVTQETTEALRVYGEGSREYRGAESNRRVVERRRDAVVAAAKLRAEQATRSPDEIAERVLRRF